MSVVRIIDTESAIEKGRTYLLKANQRELHSIQRATKQRR